MQFLPTASELAQFLADETSFPLEESQELTKVAQYYCSIIGRMPLDERLKEIFTFAQAPSPIHEYLCTIVAETPLLIVTTNYDDIIERAFTAHGRPYDIVIHATTGNEIIWKPYKKPALSLLAKDLDIDLGSTTIVYKIHGAVAREEQGNGQYVITEDDYVDFLSRLANSSAIPRIFAEPFQTRPFLFLGYGLHDWNLRVVLNRIDKELRRPGDIQSWAIETRSKPLEKKLWEKRNVVVFDELTIDRFVEELANDKRGGK